MCQAFGCITALERNVSVAAMNFRSRWQASCASLVVGAASARGRSERDLAVERSEGFERRIAVRIRATHGLVPASLGSTCSSAWFRPIQEMSRRV